MTLIYRKLVLVGFLSITLLGGCLGAKPEEEIYVAFENAAKQEKTLFADVNLLERLETKALEL